MPTNTVTRFFLTARMSLLNGRMDFMITVLAPIRSGRFMHTVAAKEWNKGKMQIKASLWLDRIARLESIAFEIRL